MTISRRTFIAHGAVSASLGFAGLRALVAARSAAGQTARPTLDGFGPLRSDPAGVLDLPDGFSYRIISRSGERMSDGLLVPGRPDGMAAFPGPDGRTLLVCNHELEPEWAAMSPFGPGNERLDRLNKALAWDVRGATPSIGGTTTLLYDTRTGELEDQWMSLAGTNRNCAGGPTPWGSWLTCEEDDRRAGDAGQRDHGWVFEVPARADRRLHSATPIKAMGRFYHEAVAVDPASGVVYMTEDRPDAAFYRFIPNEPGRLLAGGRLQALRIRGSRRSVDTRNWEDQTVEVGRRFEVEWVDLDGVHAPDDDLRYRARDLGCAVFARTEGIWYGDGAAFVACTSGGRKQLGQVWKYTPSAHEGTDREREAPGALELFIEPNDGSLVRNADNLTVAPWGDLILCEDSRETDGLVGVTPAGGIYRFARNATSDSEFAGACFSPDGTTLLVNMQSDGLTLAITGDWSRRA